jgi:hypothetical protein
VARTREGGAELAARNGRGVAGRADEHRPGVGAGRPGDLGGAVALAGRVGGVEGQRLFEAAAGAFTHGVAVTSAVAVAALVAVAAMVVTGLRRR